MHQQLKNNPGYTPRIDKAGAHRGWGWFIIPDWGITIAAPPKCGSSSLKEFFHQQKIDHVRMVNRNEVDSSGKVFFIVRNPKDRFESLWRSKCRDKAPIVDTTVYGMTPSELMDHIIAGNKDIHWDTQAEILGEINATLIPLENLKQWWRGCRYGVLPSTNETTGKIRWDENMRAKFYNFYADDFALYDRAVGAYK